MNLRTKIIQHVMHFNEGLFFYPKLKAFYKAHLPPGKLSIVDVGANKGQSVDFFRSLYPEAEIYSFEPNRNLFPGLLSKYSSDKGVHLFNKGISKINGQLEFNVNVMDETSTFETVNPDSKYLEKKARILGVPKEKLVADRYTVEVIRLTDFLNDHPDLFIDVLKIDVEGYELACLEGLFDEASSSGDPAATTRHYPVKFLQLESHQDDMYFTENQQERMECLLQANGFYPKEKIKHGFGDFYEIIYENRNLQ